MSWIAELKKLVRKSQPSSSNVHVSVPLGSEEERVRKSNLQPPIDNLEATMIAAAFSATDEAPPPAPGYAIHTPEHAQAALDNSSGKPEEGRVQAAVSRKYPGMKSEAVTKGGPGSGPHPGQGKKTLEEHHAAVHEAEKRAEAASAHDDKHPGSESRAKLNAALHERDEARQARDKHMASGYSAPTAEEKARGKAHADAARRSSEQRPRPINEEGLHSFTLHGDNGINRKEPTKKSALDPEPGERRIATVGIRHGDHMLMGKRRDNGKWTVPGGHVDPGETMHQGALREVEEESGLKLAPEDVEPLGKMVSKTAHGGTDKIHVQPFVAKLDKRPSTTMKDDPDGEVHRWNWVDVSKGLPAHIHKNMHVPPEHNELVQRLGLVDSGESEEAEEQETPGAGEEEEEGEDGDATEWTEQQALGEVVAGVDWEMMADPSLSEDQAREKALEHLEEDPGYYRQQWSDANSETSEGAFDDDGMNIDLGSGHAREPGYVGVDLYPYDHGTVVHDLSMDLPFDDQCATTVRMVNALHDMDGVEPSALMGEISRVLMPGGQFIYEGPEEIAGEDLPPYLMKTEHTQGIAKDNTEGPTWHKMAFTRVVEPDAATANDSEPRSAIPNAEMIPSDQLLATDALSYYWSDAGTSAAGNHAAGYASQDADEPYPHGVSKAGRILKRGKKVPIAKLSKTKQIVYCVVLSPNESDEQEDFCTPEDIEEACHYWMLKSQVVGAEHNRQIDGKPVENYIAPCDFEMTGPFGPQKVVKGAWVVGLKIFDKKEWAKIEDGDYQGVSLGGEGIRDPMTAVPA